MTATAGVIGVAASVAHLLHLSVDETLSAFGTAGTQAAGLWQFLLDATHSKQVHTGKACFDGIFAAYVAKSGLLGPMNILEGSAGMGATLSSSPNPSALDEKLGAKYSILESSFKLHASCRHTHPSADALLSLMDRHNLQIDDIDSIVSQTYQSAIDILSRSEKAQTVHQSKFSMGFVLAVAAKNRQATVADFTEDALKDPVLRAFQKRVTMVLNIEIDAAFPQVWKGLVEVRTKSGIKYCEAVDVVKGDPGNTLSR
jgi:2-methylcitrate dehydratase PrpD